MKVFWSWQLDTPGETCRFLIKDALEAAITKLKTSTWVDKPTTEETREAMRLDHDIKGATGSPELVRVIFEKIKSSAVLVADVTAVGYVNSEKARHQARS